MFPICFLALFYLAARAASPAAPPADPALKPGIEAALDMAQGAPGEFAADALLRVAALRALDPPRRVKLIEEAFARASGAQEPFKRRNAMPNISSSIGFEQRAFAQDLDALSLRMRAVDEMLPLDAAKARRLFASLPPPAVPAATCDDALVPDVSSYYSALAQVALRSFSPKEVRDGVAAQFVEERIAVISSPAQVAPAARAMLASGLDDAALASSAAALSEALKRISGDDRAFTFYLADAGAAIQSLVPELARRRISPVPLVEAYRGYLVANFTAVRCADDDLNNGARNALDSRSLAAIALFNSGVRIAPLQPISPDEAGAASRSGAASGLRSCAAGPCAAVASQYRALIMNAVGVAAPLAARDSDEWRGRFEDVLAALRDWQDSPDDTQPDSPAQQFRETCQLYMEMVNLAPGPHLREMALAALVGYLGRGRDRAQSRIEWLLPVNVLSGLMALDPAGLGRMADYLRRSPDPVIAMYAQLDAIAPRTAPQVLALM